MKNIDSEMLVAATGGGGFQRVFAAGAVDAITGRPRTTSRPAPTLSDRRLHKLLMGDAGFIS